jgi:hypothetical protein
MTECSGRDTLMLEPVNAPNAHLTIKVGDIIPEMNSAPAAVPRATLIQELEISAFSTLVEVLFSSPEPEFVVEAPRSNQNAIKLGRQRALVLDRTAEMPT